MIAEILYPILLAVLIIAVIFLIFVLWRAFRILTLFDQTMEEVKTTTGKVSEFVDESLKKLSDLTANFNAVISFFEKTGLVINKYFKKSEK